MYETSLLLSALATACQAIAVLVALFYLYRAGRGWLPWSAFSLAQVLMLQSRWQPLELALATGLYDFSQAWLGLAVSVASLLAGLGIGPLLGTRGNSAG